MNSSEYIQRWIGKTENAATVDAVNFGKVTFIIRKGEVQFVCKEDQYLAESVKENIPPNIEDKPDD